MLQEVQLKDANTVYAQVILNPGYLCDGTCKSLCFTTSNYTQAGVIWIELMHPGLTIVGQAETAVDATAAAGDILVRSFL